MNLHCLTTTDEALLSAVNDNEPLTPVELALLIAAVPLALLIGELGVRAIYFLSDLACGVAS